MNGSPTTIARSRGRILSNAVPLLRTAARGPTEDPETTRQLVLAVQIGAPEVAMPFAGPTQPQPGRLNLGAHLILAQRVSPGGLAQATL